MSLKSESTSLLLLVFERERERRDGDGDEDKDVSTRPRMCLCFSTSNNRPERTPEKKPLDLWLTAEQFCFLHYPDYPGIRVLHTAQSQARLRLSARPMSD